MESTANYYQQISELQKRNDLVVGHLEFVSQILDAIRIRLPDHVDVENLQSAGVVGLIEAAQNFDPTRGASFRTFAFPRIRGAIIDELRRNSPLSQKMMYLVKQVRQVIDSNPPPVTPEFIAESLGISVDRVIEALEAMRLAFPQRWDDSLGDPSLDTKPDFRAEGQQEIQERRQAMIEGLESLSERERLVITLYHLEGLRLREIGEVLHIGESRTSRVLAAAEFRLREFCRKKMEKGP
jgi:RNA polymerase sigma factor for flagellar operon FliA